MRTTQSLSITLPIEMAEMVKAKVASGEYASESEVIRDGLRTLIARDVAIEKWLAEEVAPTFDEMKAKPERALSAEDVDRRLDARLAMLRRGD
jgi:antitoxin ParD1/3/4